MTAARRVAALSLLAALLLAAGCGNEDEESGLELDLEAERAEDARYEALAGTTTPKPVLPAALEPRSLRLFGRMLDASGERAGGVEVELLRARPPPHLVDDGVVMARTTTDAEGAWSLRAEASGTVLLRTRASGMHHAEPMVVPWAGGRIDRRAHPPAGLAVTVVDDQGSISGAEVTLLLPRGRRSPIALATGHGAGRPAHIPRAPVVPLDLLVRGRAHAAEIVRSVLPRGSPGGHVVQLRRGRRLRCRVFSDLDGAPVRGARIWLREPRLGAAGTRAGTTDGAGEFAALVGAGPGNEVVVLVSAPRHGPLRARVRAEPPGAVFAEEEVMLRLAQPVLVQGRVLDVRGKPVAGATVQWLGGLPAEGWRPNAPGPARVVATDSLGRFALPWIAPADPEAGSILFAAAEERGFVVARLDEPPGKRSVRLTLSGAASVAGMVRIQNREVCRGAQIRLEREDERLAAHETGTLWHKIEDAIDMHLPRALETVTDDRGRFELGGVPPGAWRARVVHGEQEMIVAARVVVRPGDRKGDLAIEFPRGAHDLTLAVTARKHQLRVADTPGSIIRSEVRKLQGFVRVEPVGPRGRGWSTRVLLTENGKVTIPDLPDRPMRVQVIADGFVSGGPASVSPARAVVPIALEPTSELRLVTAATGAARIVLRPALETAGRGRGRPIELGGRWYVEAPDGSLTDALTIAAQHQRSELVAPQSAGRYGVPNVARGKYRVGLFWLNGEVIDLTKRVDVPGRSTVVARMTGPRMEQRRIEGRVVAFDAGATVPLTGVLCTIRPSEPRAMLASGIARARTDDDGRFAFEDMAGGVYAITFEPREGPLWEELVHGQSSTTFSVHGVGAVRVHVEDPDGKPVSNARVQILTLSGLQVGPRPMGRVDEAGTFLVEGLATGTYQIIARARGMAGPTDVTRVQVLADDTKRVWIAMTPAVRR